MSEYFRHSSTTYYSLIASLPLLLGYEILVTLTQSPFWGVRNAADVWIRTFMMAFDIRPQYIFFVMILIVIGMIPVIKVKGSAPPLKGSIFLVMFLEALAYSMARNRPPFHGEVGLTVSGRICRKRTAEHCAFTGSGTV